MAERLTLSALFVSNKHELERQLEGLALPKDNQKVQSLISDYLSGLFSSEGDFRQSLTQSEDYVLQATLSLLTAQQEMANAFISQKVQFKTVEENASAPESSEAPSGSAPRKIDDYLKSSVSAKQAAIGVGTGALIGKLALGGWGAVFGAIAGTAVTIYLAGFQSRSSSSSPAGKAALRTEIVNEPIDVGAFIGVVGGICESVDNLISTFRAQVNRVVDKYESMEKPSIEKEYRFLLESIQSLLGYKRTHSAEDEKYDKKIRDRIEDIADCLENYNLLVEDYDGGNDSLFEMVPSSETKEKRMVYPAIVKNGVAVLKGKVFVPAE